MGLLISIVMKCFEKKQEDFELSSFVHVSSTLVSKEVEVQGSTITGSTSGGCAVCETPLVQTRCYFEVTVLKQGELQIGVSALINKDLDAPLSQREKTWSHNFSTYPVNTVIGVSYDLSSVRPSLSFTANNAPIPNSTISRASGEVYPIFYVRDAQVKTNFGTEPFKYLPSGFEGLMCSIDLL